MDKLLAKGLVKRTECPRDRRAVDVVITDDGMKILAELDAMQGEWEKTLLNVTEEEANLLSDILDKLRGSV